MRKRYLSKILPLKKHRPPPKILGKKKWYSNPSAWGNVWRKVDWFFWFRPVLSGFVMGLALPATFVEFPLLRSLLAWFALIPLFNGLLRSQSYWASFVQTFVTGFLINLMGFRFLLGIHPLAWLGINDQWSLLIALTGWLIASLQGAVYWGICGLLWHSVQSTLRTKLWWIALASLLWVVWQEKIATLISNGGIPWNSLYYSQAHNLLLSQIAELTGGSGLTFLIILVNASLAFYLWANDSSIEQARQKSFCVQQIVVMCLSFVSYGCLILMLNPGFTHQNTHQALALQSDLEIADTRLTKSRKDKVAAFISSFKQAPMQIDRADLIILPEGSLNQSEAQALWQNMQPQASSSTLISGVLDDRHNAALAFNRHNVQPEPQIYIKQALVPFGEYIPASQLFKHILTFLKLAYLTENSFEAGEQAQAFALPFAQVGASICFEILSAEITSRQVQAGAEVLVLLADSSWFGSNQGLVNAQMLAAAKIRAIENRRALLVNINQGPAASINQFGQTIEYKKDSTATILHFNLQKQHTLFTKIQWQK